MIPHFNAYDRALIHIGQDLLQLGQLVSRSLSDAMQSLVDQDIHLASDVLRRDDEIDFADEAIEMQALEIISLQQPIDEDLRYLAAIMRISRDLERIADYAGDIAESTLRFSKQGAYFKPLVDIPRMGEMVQHMMKKSLQAHINRSVDTAQELDDDDLEVDRLFIQLLEELTGYMKADPTCVEQARDLLLVARYLERIGDHVVNISEMTIFAATGRRHPFKNRSRK